LKKVLTDILLKKKYILTQRKWQQNQASSRGHEGK